MDDVPTARMAADGADEARNGSGLRILDLAQRGRDVQRTVHEPERTAAHRRDERHLVAVRELAPRLDVLAVHGIEEPGRLRAEVEPRPDVLDARNVLELEPRTAGTLTEAGKEANGDAHALILPGSPRLAEKRVRPANAGLTRPRRRFNRPAETRLTEQPVKHIAPHGCRNPGRVYDLRHGVHRRPAH